VFEAELLGLSLAAKLINAEAHVRSVVIWADSQAAILATRHTRGMPRQHLVNVFHDQICAICHKHPSIDIVLRWMPGHCNLAGNECADEEANRAAQGASSPLHQLPASCRREPPVSRSAVRQSHMKKVKVKSRISFESSPRFQRLCHINPSMPSSRFRLDTTNAERWHMLMLVQLRTGHVPLQKNLSKIGRTDSPVCLAC